MGRPGLVASLVLLLIGCRSPELEVRTEQVRLSGLAVTIETHEQILLLGTRCRYQLVEAGLVRLVDAGCDGSYELYQGPPELYAEAMRLVGFLEG